MSNLKLYDSVRTVPQDAQKKITGGRLSGKTDINPMWRIKVLTEMFGICGIGWKYYITKQYIEEGANGEKAAFVNINLHIKQDGEWSEAIEGTGGSSFVTKESKGLYVSDECFKMALTDAISVACKALGVGADIYWQADANKNNPPPAIATPPALSEKELQAISEMDACKTVQELGQVFNSHGGNTDATTAVKSHARKLMKSLQNADKK